MGLCFQEGEDAAPSGTTWDGAASSRFLLLLPALHPGEREVPGTSPLLPAHGEVPQERTGTEVLFVVILFAV
jgi:hypothetical protein